MMRCLGLDLGSRSTGLCVIEGDVQSPRCLFEKTIKLTQKSLSKRLLTLVTSVSEHIAFYKPDVAILETPFFKMDVRSLSVLSQARGAVLVLLEQQNIPTLDISPASVKSAITGHGQAPKAQVARMMQQVLHVKSFSSDDASDAAAIAYAGLIQSTRNIPLEVQA